MIRNTSFLWSKEKRVSNHKARFKKQNKRRFKAADRRLKLRLELLYYWNTNNIKRWIDTMWHFGYKDNQRMRTIKKACTYSDRSRSVNAYLNISKYAIADFSRRGLIKDLKKF